MMSHEYTQHLFKIMCGVESRYEHRPVKYVRSRYALKNLDIVQQDIHFQVFIVK